MNLLKINKWNDLFAQIKANSLFKTNLVNRLSKILLASPILVARQLLMHAPHLLDKDNIRICIAGAGYIDSGNMGDIYRLLPKLLNKPDLSIMVDLIGPECENYEPHEDLLLRAPDDKKVTVSFAPLLLGEYLTKGFIPDVIILNMPGFEVHSDNWFDQDNGIEHALKNNIPVLGSSYSDDEAELDGLYASAYGFTVNNIQKNPFSFTETEQAFFTWAGETWVLKIGSGNKDYELIELCNIRTRLTDEYVELHAAEYGDHELAVQIPTILKKFSGVLNGKKYIWVEDEVYYFPESNVIKDFNGDVLFDNVELDTTYIHSIKNELIKATMSAAVLRRDYGEENDSEDHGMFLEDELNQTFSQGFMDSMRLSRPISPKDCAEALSDCFGWKVSNNSVTIENKHLESFFSILSNEINYPVFIIGLGSSIYDYHEDADPLLTGIIGTLKERHSSFILLVGEGSSMHFEESNSTHHLLGVIHKADTTSFLFLCNVEPDEQVGRFNIEDEVVPQQWSIVDAEISYKYSSKVLRGVADLFDTSKGHSTH
jgi:hypothetical protein